jgi:Uma2 family endonuclease
MTVPVRKLMTLPEFLAWEEHQEFRYEFDGFEPLAMTGGTADHNRITRRVHRALETRLTGTPCEPFGPDVKILTAGKIRYPDALVTCTPQPGNATFIQNPIVVFEVLSEGTSRIDRIDKVRDYQATGSIRRYVILEQDSIGATVFERQGERWIAFTLKDGDMLQMPEIGIDVPLSDCYAGVEMPQPADESGPTQDKSGFP